MRSEHDKIGQLKFLPSNWQEAKSTIEKKEERIYKLGDTEINFMEQLRKERLNSIDSQKGSLHRVSTFLTTSPVTQDKK